MSDSIFENTEGIMEVPLVEASKELDMDAIVGVLYYGFSQFALKPRNNDDIIGLSVELEPAKYAEDTATNSVVDFKALRVSFYPNPATNVLYFNAKNAENGTLIVRSLDGRVLSSTQIMASSRVDISTLTSGVYVLEFTTTKGQRASAKFIKL